VYDALIAEVDRYGGSVIGFSGDAITCWFAGEVGEAAHRALAASLAMQYAMQQLALIITPSGHSIRLALKVAVALGPARRFRVGDPKYHYVDVLAGATLDRMAAAEHQAQQGEIVVSAEVCQTLGDSLLIGNWCSDSDTRMT